MKRPLPHHANAPQYDEALPLARRAVQLSPGCARLRHALGRVHEKADPPQWAAAADAYERACEKDPSNVQVGQLLSARVLCFWVVE
jgi:lipopolysaccharide biosynthesis regulator YciM